jgi:hypothetical protein
VHKNRQFVEIQFAVMVLISARELHFEKSKNLIFRNRLGCRNGSYIPVLTPPFSMRCSVPRIDWMSGSAVHLKPMTRSRSRTGATSPQTACFGPN